MGTEGEEFLCGFKGAIERVEEKFGEVGEVAEFFEKRAPGFEAVNGDGAV